MQQIPNIAQVVKALEISPDDLVNYGNFAAKISYSALDRILKRPLKGKYILVTATNPTKQGEGKTVTSIALAMALAKRGKVSSANLRQSSLGPSFGMKGAGGGGGKAQIVPREVSEFHVTGDIHMIGHAHNQIAALLDNDLFFDNTLKIDPEQILWCNMTLYSRQKPPVFLTLS